MATIARRFNAGSSPAPARVPPGRLNAQRMVSAMANDFIWKTSVVPAGLEFYFTMHPALKRRAIVIASLRDFAAFARLKCNRPLPRSSTPNCHWPPGWDIAGERARPGCRFRRRAENPFPNPPAVSFYTLPMATRVKNRFRVVLTPFWPSDAVPGQFDAFPALPSSFPVVLMPFPHRPSSLPVVPSRLPCRPTPFPNAPSPLPPGPTPFPVKFTGIPVPPSRLPRRPSRLPDAPSAFPVGASRFPPVKLRFPNRPATSLDGLAGVPNPHARRARPRSSIPNCHWPRRLAPDVAVSQLIFPRRPPHSPLNSPAVPSASVRWRWPRFCSRLRWDAAHRA